MRWISSHRVLSAIILLLFVVVVLFVVSWRLKGDDGPVGKLATTIFSTVQKPMASVADKAGNGLGSLLFGGDVAEENEKLKEEIAKKDGDLARQRLSREELTELRGLTDVMDSLDPEQGYKFAAANVISYEGSNDFDIFTIDIGAEKGLEKNSVVLAGDGLCGRVLSTGHGWAKVVGIIDENNNVGFEIKKDKSWLGVCHGRGDGTLTGNMLDEEGYASEGDTVFTSGLGGIYPAGLVVGVVTKAEFTKNSPLMTLSIDPAVDFKNLRKVLVIV